MKEGEPVLGGPQANPGVTGTSNSGAQPIFSGAQATPVAEPVVPVAPQPAIPQSSAPQQNRYITQPPSHFTPQQPTSSDTGDIILAGVEPKKSKTPLIIAIVVVLLLIVGGVAAYFLLSRSGTSQTGDVSEAKEAFNYYVNYILSGEDSGKDVDEDLVWDNFPYFMTIKSTEIPDYVKTANEKYDKFFELYDKNSGGYDPAWIKSYYQDFVSIAPLTDYDIIKNYLSAGEESTQKLIEEKYNIDSLNEYLDQYVVIEKQIAETKLNIVTDITTQSCFNNNEINTECYSSRRNNDELLNKLIGTSMGISTDLYSKALTTLRAIYSEIYNVNFEGASL